MLHVDSDADQAVVEPPAEIDIATADAFAGALARACALRTATVVADFTRVTFCDTAAITALLRAADCLEAAGCRLEIRNPHPLLTRMAAVLGLADRLRLPAAG